MRYWLFLTAFLMACALAAPAEAGGRNYAAECGQSRDDDLSISACTHILNSGAATTRGRYAALVDRCIKLSQRERV